MTTIFCECKKSWSGDDLTQCPWERLEVAGRLRCRDCVRALREGAEAGSGVEAVYQPLGPRDRGGLKKLPERPTLRESPGQSNTIEWED